MNRPAFKSKRQELLSCARGKILEIGIGTGHNLLYYPEEVKEIDTVDIIPLQKITKERAKENRIKINHSLITAEKLPFDNESFDTIISSWTLCSIPDVCQALSEINRVLKPDGQFIFIEHGRSPNENIQKWQNRLLPFWKWIGCGCHLNRDIRRLVERQLDLQDCKEFELEGAHSLISHHYQGIAKKKA